MKKTEQIAEEIAVIMPRIARTIVMSFSQMQQLPPAQIFAIHSLNEKGSCRFTDLSEEMRVSAPTVTGIIDRLEKAGFVIRIHDKNDRRVINIELTKAGQKVARELQGLIKARWLTILEKLTKAEQEQYLKILNKIYAKL